MTFEVVGRRRSLLELALDSRSAKADASSENSASKISCQSSSRLESAFDRQHEDLLRPSKALRSFAGPSSSSSSSSSSLLQIYEERGSSQFDDIDNSGGGDFDETRNQLLSDAFQTKGEAVAAATSSSWRTALKWWKKFCSAVGLLEVLNFSMNSTRGKRQAINISLMFLEFVAQQSKGKGPGGHALASTSTRYLIPVRAVHYDLGIDLKFTIRHLKDWEAGRERFLRRTVGLRVISKKFGLTRLMMQDMWIEDWSSVGNEHMVQVAKTACQFAFQMLYRRSEFLLKIGLFDPKVHLTRNHLKFYNNQWQRVSPSLENLARLRNEGGWILSYPPSLKNDPTGKIWGNSPTPLLIEPSGTSYRFIDCVPWLLEMEKRDPIVCDSQRQNTPMFCDSKTGTTLRVAKFDQVFINTLRASYARKGVMMSEVNVRRTVSIHSLRIGGLNAYKKAQAPVHARKAFGRWTSRAIFGYDRDDFEELSKYVVAQDVDCELLQAADAEMPTWPQARNASPGSIALPEGSEVDDSSIVEETRSYLASIGLQPASGM